MLKFRLILVLSFLMSWSSHAFADKVFVTYKSETNYGVLNPDIREVLNQGTSTVYGISIHNSQNAYYYVKITKVGSLNGSGIPDELLLVPHQTIQLPNTVFLNGDSLALVADGSFNHWQVPTLLACDALS